MAAASGKCFSIFDHGSLDTAGHWIKSRVQSENFSERKKALPKVPAR